MRCFALLLLPALTLANIDAGGSQDPPTIPGTVLSTIINNTTAPFPTSTTGAPLPSGNLSITNTAMTTPAGGAPGSPSQSVVLVTTSVPGSGLETLTSFVPGATGGSGSGSPSAAPSGSTQPGAAAKLGSGGALGALVLAVGIGALLL